MDARRDELRRLVDELPDEQVERALRGVRRLIPRRKPTTWPPPWFAIAEGSSPDTAHRVDEVLAKGFGRS